MIVHLYILHKKYRNHPFKTVAISSGRGDGIWTHDLMVPNHARYQTALHLGVNDNITMNINYQALYLILCSLATFDTYNIY